MAIRVAEVQRTLGERAESLAWQGAKTFFLTIFGLAFVGNALPALVHEPGSALVALALGVAALYFGLRRPVGWARRTFFAYTPDAEESAPGVVAASAPDLPPVPPDSLYVGDRLDGGPEIRFTAAQRARHTYLVGKTRTGKTSLMKRLVVQEIALGHGCGFIDPHGDAVHDLLGLVPEDRMDDVIYFDPTSPTCPIFNPLGMPYDHAKLTADIISALKMFFGSSWGPRLEHLLRFALLTLLADEYLHTLADLRRLLVHDDYRATVLARVTHEQLREFWAHEWEDARQSVPAVMNKLSEFLVPTSALERLFSTPKSEVDFPAMMNGGKIFLANLGKGALGEEPSRLLGGLITTCIQQAALARTTLPEAERRPFSLYVDEFQNYTVASFATILAESAKYRLHLTLANQNLGQLPAELERAIFGNVATLVSFQVSAEDAPKLRREMHRSRIVVRIPESPDYVSLADFVAYQKELYRKARDDRKLGMTNAEYRKFEDLGLVDQVKLQNARIDELERVARTLERPDLNVSVLRELFPDYDFREETFPEVDDFLNLTPHHGLCRIERAENVFPFVAPLPPEPDATRRDRILAAAPWSGVASPKPPPPPPPAPAPATEETAPPQTDADFTF